MKNRQDILNYLVGKKLYCKNDQEKKILITFFVKNSIPINEIIPRYLNSGDAHWDLYYISNDQIEASGYYGNKNYVRYFEYSKILGLKKLKQPKWKSIWKDN